MAASTKIHYGNTDKIPVPAEALESLVCYSSDPTVADVSNGIIIALRLGSTTISYTYTLNGETISDSIDVEVLAGKHKNSENLFSMQEGDAKVFRAFAVKGLFDSVKYRSSSPDTVSVETIGNSAVLRALAPGNATIYSKINICGEETVRKSYVTVDKKDTRLPLPVINPLSGADFTENDDWIGSRVYFGNFIQKKDAPGVSEPILWRVLEVADDNILLLAEYGLYCQNITHNFTDYSWSTCTIRKWLNDDFLGIAFTRHETTAIQDTVISVNGVDTVDKAFILSTEEVLNPDYGFMPSNEASRTRYMKCTEFAINNGGYAKPSNGNTCWWLRTPGCSTQYAAYVFTMGKITESYFVGRRHDAIRPAIRVKLSDIYFAAPETAENPKDDFYKIMVKAPLLC